MEAEAQVPHLPSRVEDKSVSLLYAIDPGVHQCGLAEFFEGRLQATGFLKTEAVTKLIPREVVGGVRVVCEFPKVYQGGKQKGDPADLLELAFIVGRLDAHVPVQRVLPHEWKGQLDKKQTWIRALERLDEKEKKVVEGLKNHNVRDAVAIGLWALGRFERKRVFAR